MQECNCSCHEDLRKAQEKQREARKRGEFYYYHCDCYCCAAAYLPSFGALIKKESAHDTEERQA